MKHATFLIRLPWITASLAILVTEGISITAHAEEPRPQGAQKRIALLEAQVDELQKNVGEIHGAETPDHLRKNIKLLESKLDASSVKLSEIEQAGNAGNAADEERDARLDDLSKEIAALWEDVQKQRKSNEETEANSTAGYDNGFFIGSRDGKFKLTINGFVRPYYRIGLQKTWKTDEYGTLVRDGNDEPIGGDVEIQENTFGMANGRVVLNAELLGVLRGKFEIDYGTVSGTVQYPINAAVGNARYNKVSIDHHSLRFLDAYGEYAPIPEFRVRLGQFKVPFDRESLFYADHLTFTTRSLMTRPYPMWGEVKPEDGLAYRWDYEIQRGASFGRDTGIEVGGHVRDGLFQYAAGVFNGAGANTENDNRDVLIAARLVTDPLGPMTPGMSDLKTVKKPLVRIGVAFAYDLLEHVSAIEPLATYNSSDLNLTADAHFKWHGIALLASIFYRNADHGAVFIDEDGNDGPMNSIGMQAQLSYFNDYTHLEPGFRYSTYDADMSRELDHIHEISAAVGYYPFMPHLKIQIEYRGLFAARTDRTYLVPFGVWYDYYNEISIMAQVAF